MCSILKSKYIIFFFFLILILNKQKFLDELCKCSWSKSDMLTMQQHEHDPMLLLGQRQGCQLPSNNPSISAPDDA